MARRKLNEVKQQKLEDKCYYSLFNFGQNANK